ncbi:hypothetical protein PSPO01_07556 [Paraphaeosphaeria sporulosa]
MRRPTYPTSQLVSRELLKHCSNFGALILAGQDEAFSVARNRQARGDRRVKPFGSTQTRQLPPPPSKNLSAVATCVVSANTKTPRNNANSISACPGVPRVLLAATSGPLPVPKSLNGYRSGKWTKRGRDRCSPSTCHEPASVLRICSAVSDAVDEPQEGYKVHWRPPCFYNRFLLDIN